MEEFNHHSVSRHELNVRAAHSLCRAGWMLTEINGVLKQGYIRPENFRAIQQQATTFDQLQQKFGPPKTTLQASAEDINLSNIKTTRLPRIRVMNRGVEEATAVLIHYGWTNQQIRQVLKTTISPLDNVGLTLMNDLPAGVNRSFPNRYRSRRSHLYPIAVNSARRSKAAALKALITLFCLGVMAFIGVLLILHML